MYALCNHILFANGTSLPAQLRRRAVVPKKFTSKNEEKVKEKKIFVSTQHTSEVAASLPAMGRNIPRESTAVDGLCTHTCIASQPCCFSDASPALVAQALVFYRQGGCSLLADNRDICMYVC